MGFKYVALDFETSALCTAKGLPLAVCMVVDRIGSRMPTASLPTLNLIIQHNKLLYGDEVALKMNAALIDRINNDTPRRGERVVPMDALSETITNFLVDNKVDINNFVLAGKNPAFDARWLKVVAPEIKCHHRMLDPTILYMQLSDISPPNLATCMGRAGITQDEAHNQLCDTIAIVKLLRNKFNGNNGN
jgi:hypothetical protein